MDIPDKIKKIFIKTALKEISEHEKSNVCCIIYHNSDILSIGCNSLETVRYIGQFKYLCPSVHAEVNAISRLIKPGIKKRIKLNMFILRASKTGLIGNAIPCKHCLEFLKSDMISNLFAINKITFSCDRSNFITKKMIDISNEHVSRGWLRFKI